jgi:hypothetical protein
MWVKSQLIDGSQKWEVRILEDSWICEYRESGAWAAGLFAFDAAGPDSSIRAANLGDDRTQG